MPPSVPPVGLSPVSKPNAKMNTKTNTSPSSPIDPNSGFCSVTKIYRSLRPPCPLPPPSAPISLTDIAFSLLLRSYSSPPSSSPAFIDVVSGASVSFPDFVSRTRTLSSSIQRHLRLKKGDVAFILSPSTVQVPILYYALLSLGVVVSPSNPASSEQEIAHQIQLSKPVVAFATSETSHRVRSLKTIILDSSEFQSWEKVGGEEFERVPVYQSDAAAILYSSGTTGRVKGVLLTHRNFTANLAASHSFRAARSSSVVNLCTAPYFHVYGMSFCLRAAAMGETVVSIGGRFDMRTMLGAIQEFRVTHVAFSPPLVVAMVKDVGVIDGYDLSSLEVVACGGSSLRNSIVEQFGQRFPHVQLAQAYGLTESTARVFATLGPEESQVVGATGKLMPNSQAKIVDPETGIPLPPCSAGELWIRGPYIMKGYVGDDEATAATLDSEGWLKTGDLCYIDNEGFLFFVDRIKELIKYKGYQVAPAELEHLLQSHPDIVEAAVVPYPDEEAGQIPVAFVVRKMGSTIEETQIKDFITQQVAPYKRIRRVMFINSLPKNATGKVLRKELIKIALSANSKL